MRWHIGVFLAMVYGCVHAEVVKIIGWWGIIPVVLALIACEWIEDKGW